MNYSSNNKEQDPRSPGFDLGQWILDRENTTGSWKADYQNTWHDISSWQESDTSGRKWANENTWVGEISKPVYFSICSYCGINVPATFEDWLCPIFEDWLCPICMAKRDFLLRLFFGVDNGGVLHGSYNNDISFFYSGDGGAYIGESE